jgi:transposase
MSLLIAIFLFWRTNIMKIVYPICCGIDVHKKFIVATISSTNDKGVTTYVTKEFSTFNSGIQSCLAFLLENNCKVVCMESTGKYWIPVYNILEVHCNITLANPKYVRAIKR